MAKNANGGFTVKHADVDMRRPRRDPESILEFALNGGRVNQKRMRPMAQADFNKLSAAVAEGTAPAPNIYQPVLVDAARKNGVRIAAPGQGKEQPEGWNEGQLGKHNKGDVLTKPRPHHNADLRKRVGEDALVTIEGLGTFVLGLEGVNPQITGNYAAITQALKKALFANVKGMSNIVGRFNDTAYIDYSADGSYVVWNAYQSLDWGYLTLDGKRLSHTQVSKTDSVGVSFEPLDEPITRTITVAELLPHVKTIQGDAYSGDEKTTRNIGTLCRFRPIVLHCFGFRNAQAGHPIYRTWVGKDLDEVICMTVGSRLPVVEAKKVLRARLAPAKTPKNTSKTVKDVKPVKPVEDTAEAPPVEDTAEVTVDNQSGASAAAKADMECLTASQLEE